MKQMMYGSKKMGNWMDDERKRSFDDRSSRPAVVSREIPLGTSHDFYLTSDIVDSTQYDEWIHTCAESRPCDMIEVHINCYGGSLDTAIQIHDMLMAAKADVYVSIEGACCSGASLIAMAGDHVRVLPNSYMMIHSWTGGTYGKFGNVIENTEFQKKWFADVMTRSYSEFLSKAEIKEILDGKDIYMDAEEMSSRFKARDTKREERAKAREKQIEDAKAKVMKILEPKGLTMEDLM